MKLNLNKNLTARISKISNALKLKKSPLKIIIPVGFLVLMMGGIFVFYYINKNKSTPAPQLSQNQSLLPQAAAKKAIDYINENLLQEGLTASLIGVVEENGIYRVNLEVGGQKYDSYVTKDGKLLFAQGINLDQKPQNQDVAGSETPAEKEVKKQDIPDVKLFVMSYCPYGLQAEKALLPVWELLKDKAIFGIYFVDYVMHDKKEIDENLRQYCIEKEEPEKFIPYLKCFVKSGDYEKCQNDARVVKEKLAACQSATDKEFKITQNYTDKTLWLNATYPKFLVDSDLNKMYGVQGSPVLVLNGVVISLERSPEAFKLAICEAFSTSPQECSQKLSTDNASAGIGESTGGASGGSCE